MRQHLTIKNKEKREKKRKYKKESMMQNITNSAQHSQSLAAEDNLLLMFVCQSRRSPQKETQKGYTRNNVSFLCVVRQRRRWWGRLARW